MQQAEEFFQAVQQTWQQAAQDCPPSYHFYRIGDLVVQLQIVGERLVERLTSALSHLTEAAQKQTDLTIYLWESAISGIRMPPIPFDTTNFDTTNFGTTNFGTANEEEKQETWSYFFHDQRFQLFYQPEQQTFTFLASHQNQAYYWVEDAQSLLLSDGGAPLLMLLHWWFSSKRYQVVHGAAIGTTDGAALLVGKSGSGKSTTALACLAAGLNYLGDDYCLVANQPVPMVYSLYSSGKIHFVDLVRFPVLQPARTNTRYTQADKALFFFGKHVHFGKQIVPALPLRAILLPVITHNQQSSWHKISPSAALLALAPSTVLQLVGNKSQTLQQLGQLVRQLPCYQLSLGCDFTEIPAAIPKLLSTLRKEETN